MRTYMVSFSVVILLIAVLFAGVVTVPAAAQLTTGTLAKRVMFRDDDVTPWSLGALRAVNQVHIDEGVPVTLGVIPAQSFRVQSQGNPYVPTTNSPETFVDYLRPLASSGQFELAQHGYQHSDNSVLYGIPVPSEFRGMPYSAIHAYKEGAQLDAECVRSCADDLYPAV